MERRDEIQILGRQHGICLEFPDLTYFTYDLYIEDI